MHDDTCPIGYACITCSDLLGERIHRDACCHAPKSFDDVFVQKRWQDSPPYYNMRVLIAPRNGTPFTAHVRHPLGTPSRSMVTINKGPDQLPARTELWYPFAVRMAEDGAKLFVQKPLPS